MTLSVWCFIIILFGKNERGCTEFAEELSEEAVGAISDEYGFSDTTRGKLTDVALLYSSFTLKSAADLSVNVCFPSTCRLKWVPT